MVDSPSSPEDPHADSTRTERTERTAMARSATHRSWQRQVVKLDPSALDGRIAHRAMRRPAAFRGAAGIEDLEAVALLVQWQVRVPEDDGPGIGEAGSEPLQAALGGTGVMDHAQDDLF